ncbi:MAG: ABC transporter permease [Candidatus Heimdallarchaeota archaeon]|nr:ABC transporter permease [Candidatus Heimdallarchaeota archaeon]
MNYQRINAMVKMDLKKITRKPLFMVFNLFFSAFLVIVFGFSFKNNYGWGPEKSIFEYMLPGLFSYAGIITIQQVAISLCSDRDLGIKRRIFLTKTTSTELVVSQVISYSILPILQAIIIAIAAFAFGFRPNISFFGLILVLLLLILLTLSSVGFGLITAIISKNADIAGGLAWIFILPQQLFGTFIYMGTATDIVGKWTPSWYVTNGLHLLFDGTSITDTQVLKDLLIIFAVAISVYLAGVLLYRRDTTRRN